MIAALLAVGAAIAAAQAVATPTVPMAITQPLGGVVGPAFSTRTGPITESGLIVIVGGCLLGLAALVRRTTGI